MSSSTVNDYIGTTWITSQREPFDAYRVESIVKNLGPSRVNFLRIEQSYQVVVSKCKTINLTNKKLSDGQIVAYNTWQVYDRVQCKRTFRMTYALNQWKLCPTNTLWGTTKVEGDIFKILTGSPYLGAPTGF